MTQAPDILGFINQQKQSRTQGLQNLGNSVAGILRQKAQKDKLEQTKADQLQAAEWLGQAAQGGEGSEELFTKAFQLAPRFTTGLMQTQKLRAETRDAANEPAAAQAALEIDAEDSKFDKGQKILKGYNDASKDFFKVRDANARIEASIEAPDAAGDIALIFNYMKMLDPGSTVREGEFATASEAGGVDSTVRNAYNKLIDGQRLQPEQRSMFASRANKLFAKAETQNSRDRTQALNIGRRFGLEANDIFGQADDSGQPVATEASPSATELPATNAEGWGLMTDANGNKAYVGPNGEIQEVN
tara:strand:+ start:167 stop:1072 length:906 start_codon:yes stop_codon:yes gene_type:complete